MCFHKYKDGRTKAPVINGCLLITSHKVMVELSPQRTKIRSQCSPGSVEAIHGTPRELDQTWASVCKGHNAASAVIRMSSP
mmetsp:Transcript_86989/g.151820  ORF Transcript_86989/g.151820 Transcript_86989/m.151820 type:complete len:81 (-) Transcript_86989:127-369(-)